MLGENELILNVNTVMKAVEYYLNAVEFDSNNQVTVKQFLPTFNTGNDAARFSVVFTTNPKLD